VIGLPPPPADVLRFTLGFELLGEEPTCSFWIRCPRIAELEDSELASFLGPLEPAAKSLYVDVTHHNLHLAVLRLATFGPRRLTFLSSPLDSFGVFEFAAPDNVAVCLHWLTAAEGSGRDAITHLPGAPTAMTGNQRSITSAFFGQLRSAGESFLSDVNAITTSLGDHLQLGTLHRSEAGAPLPASLFEPFHGVLPTQIVGTLRRRIPRRGLVRT